MVTTPQNQSRILTLPAELRMEIWKLVFANTRLTFGHAPFKISQRRHVRKTCPARNSLALLSTCRQIHQEAIKLWPRLVTFNFFNVESVLNVLTPLPETLLCHIRHVRTGGAWAMFMSPKDVRIGCGHVLSLLALFLPALRLDNLTVFLRYSGRHSTVANVRELACQWDGSTTLKIVVEEPEVLRSLLSYDMGGGEIFMTCTHRHNIMTRLESRDRMSLEACGKFLRDHGCGWSWADVRAKFGFHASDVEEDCQAVDDSYDDIDEYVWEQFGHQFTY